MKSTTRKTLFVIIFAVINIVFLNIYVFAATGTVTGSSVRIRKEASSTAEVISVATKGEKVEVLDEENGWYKINFEDVTGYISADFVETDYQSDNSSSEITDTNEVVDNSVENTDNTTNDATTENEDLPITTNDDEGSLVNSQITLSQEIVVKKLPTFSSKSNGNIGNGAVVTVLDELNNWVKINDGTTTGWALKTHVQGTAVVPDNTEPTTPDVPVEPDTPSEPVNNNTTTEPDTELPDDTTTPDSTDTSVVGKTGKINVDSARIRESADGTIIDVVDLNDTVEILAEEGEWYKVNVEEHKGCYIAKRLVTLD